MVLYARYKGKEIKYISFAKWYTVFCAKEDGSTAMHHFSSPEEAKEFIDSQEHANEFWWMK